METDNTVWNIEWSNTIGGNRDKQNCPDCTQCYGKINIQTLLMNYYCLGENQSGSHFVTLKICMLPIKIFHYRKSAPTDK